MIESHIEYSIPDSVDDEWDRFVSGVPSAQFEQTSSWAIAKAGERWSAVRIKLCKSGELIAGAQILVKSIRYLGKIGYLKNGPLFSYADNETKAQILVDLLKVNKDLNLTYFVIHPTYSNDFYGCLKESGFRLSRGVIPPVSLSEATLIIDLSNDENHIIGAMRRKTRKKIRSSLEAGFDFKEGSRADIPKIFDLMKAVCLRRNESPNPDSSEAFEKIWDSFRSREWFRLFLVIKEEEIVCGGFVFTVGDTVRFWKYGWSGKYSDLCPNYFLHWKLIEWSKLNGFRNFDIIQVEQQIAQALKDKRAVPQQLRNHRIYGPTYFKVGFGGEIVQYPGTYYRFESPLLRNSIPFLLKSSLIRKVATKIGNSPV